MCIIYVHINTYAYAVHCILSVSGLMCMYCFCIYVCICVYSCHDSDIHVLCFPAHTTHLLQPLDNSIFSRFKCAYSNACSEWVRTHPTITFNKPNVAAIVGSIWNRVMTVDNIVDGFKGTGIYPLDADKIPLERYRCSTLFQYANSTANQLILHSPLINVTINIPPASTNPKPKKTKVDTTHATFLTDDNILDKIQKELDEKKKQQQQVTIT